MTEVRSAINAILLTRDELSEVRARSDVRMAGPSYTLVDEDRARLLATVEHLQDAALDATAERDMTRYRHRTVVPYQAEYLAFVVECLDQVVEVPSAVVEPIPAPDGPLTLVLVQRGERFGWWVPGPGWDGWNILGEFYRDPADAVKAAKGRTR